LNLQGLIIATTWPQIPGSLRAAITATLEPVVAAVVALSLVGEYFTALGYAGSALILAAVVLVVWTEPGGVTILHRSDAPSPYREGAPTRMVKWALAMS
jgi:hypothetical protein